MPLAVALIDGRGRQAARRGTPAENRFASGGESQGDRVGCVPRRGVWRYEHDDDCDNERSRQNKQSEAPRARHEPAGICDRYFPLTRKCARRFLAQQGSLSCRRQTGCSELIVVIQAA